MPSASLHASPASRALPPSVRRATTRRAATRRAAMPRAPATLAALRALLAPPAAWERDADAQVARIMDAVRAADRAR